MLTKLEKLKRKMKKAGLKTLTPKRIEEAFEYQHKHVGWTFYQEKEVAENVFQTRFNFLLAVYALFLHGFIQINNDNNGLLLKLGVLGVGWIIITIMGLSLYRIYKRYDILLKILYRFNENHVLPVVDTEIKEWKTGLFGVLPLMGIFVPLVLFLSFCAGIILVFLKIL